MADKLKTIVVRLKPNHPGGKRNRAGFSFSSKPTAVQVTPEQEEMIVADKHLLLITKGEAVKQAMKELQAKGEQNKAQGAPEPQTQEAPSEPAPAVEEPAPEAEPVETEVKETKKSRKSK